VNSVSRPELHARTAEEHREIVATMWVG